MFRESVEASVLAIIPARGGSKRIPRKNIRPFLGIPMLARTIGTLKSTNLFARIVVSTDDDEIAAIARDSGAEAPFRRPAELANDAAATLPVIKHGIEELERQGFRSEYVCCVYPAAVLSLVQDFVRAYEELIASGANYVFSATSFPYPIQRALRKTSDGHCEMLWPENLQRRSQDLEPAFHDAGQFYFGRRDAWLTSQPIFGSRSKLVELPRHRVQDIDALEDWDRAEMIFKMLNDGHV
ncbi:MAG: pseudaminic acid cytidylyltransferase [Steroidobacter sp.]